MPLNRKTKVAESSERELLLHLSRQLGSDDIRLESTRVGFGRGLSRAAELDSKVVGLSGDLAESVGMGDFMDEFSERYVEVGVAEQNLVTVASGMAAVGYKPFAASYAAFSPGRNWEQIRTTICLNDQPVVIVGSHAGLSVGPDGATHQVLEDIALMRSLPNMIVIAPGDSVETEKAVIELAKQGSPAYLRLSRDSTPVFTTMLTPFDIGKAYVMRSGHDVTVCATGTMTYRALIAARQLAKKGITTELIHIPTIKPLDEKTIIASVRKTNRVVTIEDGQVAAGFGSSIAELLANQLPVPVLRLGVVDRFGQSGKSEELYEEYGLDSDSIAKKIQQFIHSGPNKSNPKDKISKRARKER